MRKPELARGAREVTGARNSHEKPQRRQAIAHQESPIHSAHKYMLVPLAIYRANRQRGRFASAENDRRSAKKDDGYLQGACACLTVTATNTKTSGWSAKTEYWRSPCIREAVRWCSTATCTKRWFGRSATSAMIATTTSSS